MLFHNLSDYIRKIISGPHSGESHSAKEMTTMRLNGQERLQHLVLSVAFFTLAYSGFALKYPEQWWAQPFHAGGETLRKAVHRWTALVFCLTGIWHLLYMVGTRRGRFLLRHNLLPRLRDLGDPIRVILFNLGLRKEKVKLSYPSYIEKSEYWALVWGSVIMVLTGSLLVFNDFTLQHLPVWVSNLATLIHFYEAVLAFLSILVWHFYWTIFDPEVYPMNMSWMTGRLKKGKNPDHAKK